MNKQPINFDEKQPNKKSPWGKVAMWLGIIAVVSAIIIGIWGSVHWQAYSAQENIDEFLEPLSWNGSRKEEQYMDALPTGNENFSQSRLGTVVLDKEFPAEKITSIRIDTDGMNVVINKNSENQIHCQMIQTANTNRTNIRYKAQISGQEFIFKSKKGYDAMMIVLYIPEQSYDRLRINTASGDIQLVEGFDFEEIAINNASGDIQLQTIKSSSLKLNTVSGDLSLQNSNIQQMKVNSVSGDIRIENKAKQFNGKVDTVSGNVEWIIPTGMDFGYKLTTVSGEIYMGNDRTSGKIVYDSASSNYLKMDSVSGNLAITEITNTIE